MARAVRARGRARKGGVIMKRKKALKKQLKRLMKLVDGYDFKENQMGMKLGITDAIVMVARELRKGKNG